MRLGLFILAVAALASCADDRAARLAAEWGCGPVDGLAAISGDNAPDWILVGEYTETNETPAAVADIACHLATDGLPLFVGVSEYFGGATDAETKMLATLETMIAKGAPLIVASIGGEDHPYTVREKSKAEKAWAEALTQKVAAAGASRAVLLVARANAIAAPIARLDDRFAGYSPMPTFLEGVVVSLEVASSPTAGLPRPAIRLHPKLTEGFHGELALSRMTRPTIEIILPTGRTETEAVIDDEARLQRLNEEVLGETQAWTGALLDDAAPDASLDLPSLQPQLDLPEFIAE